jgi:hypothetical protein
MTLLTSVVFIRPMERAHIDNSKPNLAMWKVWQDLPPDEDQISDSEKRARNREAEQAAKRDPESNRERIKKRLHDLAAGERERRLNKGTGL